METIGDCAGFMREIACLNMGFCEGKLAGSKGGGALLPCFGVLKKAAKGGAARRGRAPLTGGRGVE